MTIKKILKEIEEKSERKFLPIIGPHKAEVLKRIIRKHKLKNALEIGTLVGYSSIIIANELPEDGKLTCLEINEKFAKIAEENIKSVKLDKKIKIIIGDAKKSLPKIHQKFDLVFIDAVKEEYLTYLKLVEKNLKKGSVIIADNVKIFVDDMRDYLSYVRNSEKYENKYMDVPESSDGMEVSIVK